MIIGLDVGGTNTDVVLLDENGLVKQIKVATEPSALFNSVLTGIESVTRDIDPSRIKRAVLSTTLTTNAIVQRDLPPAGMIVSAGPGLNPAFFRTGEHYYTVSGSIDHRGREIEPIEIDEIKRIAEKLEAEGVKHLGIVGKFSTRNPEHELEIKKALEGPFEKIFLGHEISGNLNFPRRIATTFLNASVYPLHKDFFEAVKFSLEKKGLNVPIHILKADGGTMSFASSLDFPGQSILSGPAASVMGAISSASEDQETIILDIGGTTTDIGLMIGNAPILIPLGIELNGYKTLIRSLDTRSIGIGGDSTVKVIGGEIKIGPDRMGPAMAYGGRAPTPTDALTVMGLIEDGDVANSIKGIEAIASQIGLSIEKTATMIFNKASNEILLAIEKMIKEINSKPVYTVHEMKEGYKVNPKKALILGGPAPYFAKRLEELSDYSVSVVPQWDVANAIGAAIARTTCEVTLLADTEREIISAPEENWSENISGKMDKKAAIKKAIEILEKKAMKLGADMDDLDTEVVESLEFNMVRGFYTTGKNIRIKVQVKPGIIKAAQKK